MDLMLDIETLGLSINSVVTDVAWCIFDPKDGRIIRTYQVYLPIQEQLNKGRVIDWQTLKWRISNTPEFFRLPYEDFSSSFGTLGECLKGEANNPEIKRVWCHPSFDIPILNDLTQTNLISYRKIRDLRTLSDLAGNDESKPKDKPHTALEDCEFQIKYVVEALKKIKSPG